MKGHDAVARDIKVTDGEGGEVEWTGLDLCSISKVTLRLKGKKAWADLE
ncbi:MAG: hypothetical protein KJ062_10010 [Thermoanaerobaculia bacterium]|nr:hypothetical protein [Thermoanaerobaculia bacterium]